MYCSDYELVKLFSEGLYKSPNKAVEELVSNSFDAGAKRTYVTLSPDLNTEDATIAVVDDGEGMDRKDLRRHWHIGKSNKRRLRNPPMDRKQIGKFGIGKMSTYVLANRLTHVSKRRSKYYSTSIDYREINGQTNSGVTPKEAIKIPLRELTVEQAQQAVKSWAEPVGFNLDSVPLFGDNSPESWTISIMSELKPKVHEIQLGRLRWILRTALPLRPDFGIWLNGEELKSSKIGRAPFKRWIIGKDITDLPRPGPDDARSLKIGMWPSPANTGLDLMYQDWEELRGTRKRTRIRCQAASRTSLGEVTGSSSAFAIVSLNQTTVILESHQMI